MMRSHEYYMQAAISAAAANVAAPFGSVLVDSRDGRIVATGCNRTAEGPIWHGEIDVMDRASRQLAGTQWRHTSLYTTAEPCCMCQGAIVWAGISAVVYGTSIEMLSRLGWRQIDITAAEVSAKAAWSSCSIRGHSADLHMAGKTGKCKKVDARTRSSPRRGSQRRTLKR